MLCVGRFMKWNVDMWYDEGQEYIHLTNKSRIEITTKILGHWHYGARHGLAGYVTSAGTCSGDSGGPLYTEPEPGVYVVTGVVSGGRGELGFCGGINNPVHYVRYSQGSVELDIIIILMFRVKEFGSWIEDILQENSEELCWDQ